MQTSPQSCPPLFRPGDAVAIDMPLTADAVAIYLGIVLAGCTAVSIAGVWVQVVPVELATTAVRAIMPAAS